MVKGELGVEVEEAKETKLRQRGRPKKDEQENKPSDTRFKSLGERADSDYLTARIARDRPDILDRMKSGEFPSVRQAAKEAGIVIWPASSCALTAKFSDASTARTRSTCLVLTPIAAAVTAADLPPKASVVISACRLRIMRLHPVERGHCAGDEAVVWMPIPAPESPPTPLYSLNHRRNHPRRAGVLTGVCGGSDIFVTVSVRGSGSAGL